MRNRRIAIGALASPLLFGFVVLLLQGSTFGNGDERVRAEPLGGQTAEAEPALQLRRGPDEPRLVRTFRVTSTPSLLAAPAEIVACAQPPVGTWAHGSGPDQGCFDRTAGAGPSDRPATASPEPDPSDRSIRAASLTTEPPTDGPAANLARSEPAERPAAAVAPDAGAPKPAPVIITGRWMPRGGCSRRSSSQGDCIPLVINADSAKAGGATCRFAEKKQTGGRFAILAHCANGAESWTAHVKLVVAGNRMTWSSERGSQDYVR